MAPSLLAAATSLLLLPPALVSGMYTKSSPVIQLDAGSYSSLIAQSNHTSIVEFYAPWCGHCKNLKPAYEKAATSLSGLAKVAAIDCDEEANKQFCGSMGVQGFPTLKIVKPGKKPGRPIVEDYQGPRTAKGIVEAVKDKIPNHVARLKGSDYATWLAADEKPKAILFSEKGVTSAVLKAVAVDFLGGITVGQIRSKEKEAVEAFELTKFPTLLLFPGGENEPITFDGDMKKDAIVKFLSQAGSPNPDPAPKAKKAKKNKASKDSKKPKASKPAAHPAAEDGADPGECPYKGDKGEKADDKAAPEPVKAPEPAPSIKSLAEKEPLQQKCLNSKSGLCILAILPETVDDATSSVVRSLSEIQHKHTQAKRKLFPFYQIPSTNPIAGSLRAGLGLESSKDAVALIALNGKKAFYRPYTAAGTSRDEVESWIDGLRMGDSTAPKHDVPSELIVDASELPTEKKEEPVRVQVNTDEAMGENTEEMEEMIAQIRKQMPEGMDMHMDKIDDETYERLMKAGAKVAKDKKEADEGHDEL